MLYDIYVYLINISQIQFLKLSVYIIIYFNNYSLKAKKIFANIYLTLGE